MQVTDTWSPGPRPGWVQHALDGEGGPVFELAAQPFDAAQLLAEAQARAGLSDFDGDSYAEPLAVLAQALDDEADLHLVGRWRVREVVLQYLENRLRITETQRRDPGIADEPLDRPLVVTGSPRAGTSILHQMLAQDPDARAPRAWEFWCPSPPPDPATYESDARIALANREVRLSAALAPSFDGIHEQGGLLPRECGVVMGVDLRADLLWAHYHVPSFAAWYLADDLRSGLEWHRRVLQVLQRRFEPRRWVLKWPGYLRLLPTLLATYPDVGIVVCHRDPLEMLSSVTSLMATLRWAHANHVDYQALARELADYYADLFDHHVALRRAGAVPDDSVFDVHYADFVADPVATVWAIHAHFGLDFSAEHERRVGEHLAAKPKGRHGGHSHHWRDLGLDLDEQRQRFGEYQEYFGIGSEELDG